MREIWLLEDPRVGHAVKPAPGGGLTGLPCQIRVRSCISTQSIGFDSYWGKTSPPYIYEGPRPIEGITIELNITFTFYLQTLSFPTSMLFLY
jgi:hypothetical protein